MLEELIPIKETSTHEETFTAIVSRVTYCNPEDGWSVLQVKPLEKPEQQETVTLHQSVFAGATVAFHGTWVENPKYGRQFKATRAIEEKPATTATLEKYLSSGLIKGVGAKTAAKIVKHFRENTLDIFENDIDRITEVRGVAKQRLKSIATAWSEHQDIREVMMFLQSHGISTLFAVRIYKRYGDHAISRVKNDPYRLANDFYGIGFLSADKVALSLGLAQDSPKRLIAAIEHILAASRREGHCYLTESQIIAGVQDLISVDIHQRASDYLEPMAQADILRVRKLDYDGTEITGYYARTVFNDETAVAQRLMTMNRLRAVDPESLDFWIQKHCTEQSLTLSEEQTQAVKGVVQHDFSILTGGPGCGKTTTTQVIVHLLEAFGKKVLLAAPTGRASQRLREVVGREAKTLHRLLHWKNGRFQVNEDAPLNADFLIVDECSMLDISLSAALFKAVPPGCQVLFIGDTDQLPSVGPGNVLNDMMASGVLPSFRLTQIFRQAQSSSIIQFAHQINAGELPPIPSPLKHTEMWEQNDCLFIDSDEATKSQLDFIARVKRFFDEKMLKQAEDTAFEFGASETIRSYEPGFTVPEKFKHVDLETLYQSDNDMDAMKAVLEKVHPWSSLHAGLSAVDTVCKLYLAWIPAHQGPDTEIQILTPMRRGSLGTLNLNKIIQAQANPPEFQKAELTIGDRILREGDRVIHTRNNYDLNVFNGDIGQIIEIDESTNSAHIAFSSNGRVVHYKKEDMRDLDLAYAITIHKSQGSEFKSVIIPILTQHFKMLYRNLIYTGLTRAKSLAVFVGTRRVLSMAVSQQDSRQRQTALAKLISQNSR